MEPVAKPAIHPCVQCGACCTFFRVQFQAIELRTPGLDVPSEYTERYDQEHLVMMGTNQQRPRCVALGGRIGREVTCSIYARRPSCCRDFRASFEDGRRNPRCDDARKSKGLRPLTALDYVGPDLNGSLLVEFRSDPEHDQDHHDA